MQRTIYFRNGTKQKKCNQVSHLKFNVGYFAGQPEYTFWILNYDDGSTLRSIWLDQSGEKSASVLPQASFLFRKICHLKTLRGHLRWFVLTALVYSNWNCFFGPGNSAAAGPKTSTLICFCGSTSPLPELGKQKYGNGYLTWGFLRPFDWLGKPQVDGPAWAHIDPFVSFHV